MADKTQNVKTRLSFDGEAEYKAACKEINSTLRAACNVYTTGYTGVITAFNERRTGLA